MKKTWFLITLLIIFMSTVIVQAQVVNHADDFVTKKNYTLGGAGLNSVTYGNKTFVAVGHFN